jgi:hypothetical protein
MTYASQSHERTRRSKYTAQPQAKKPLTVNFIAPKTVIWNRGERHVLAVKKTTTGNSAWCQISIGANMKHWIKSKTVALDLAAICAKLKAQQPQPVAFRRGGIVLVAA